MRSQRWLVGCVLLCFWFSGCVPTVKPEPVEVATAVLQEIAPHVCPVPDVYADKTELYHQFHSQDNTTQFECIAAAGHMTYTTLIWYDSQTEADVAFEARRGENLVTEFHESPLLMWKADDTSFPGGHKEHQFWLWQAGQWLIEIHSFDDTHFAIAPSPETVADTLYRIGQEHDLFALGEQAPD